MVMIFMVERGIFQGLEGNYLLVPFSLFHYEFHNNSHY